MMRYRLDIEYHSSVKDENTLLEGLKSYNIEQTKAAIDGGPINIFIRNDDNNILGGLKAFYYLKSLYIEYLYLNTSIRGTGLGKKLLQMAETEAIKQQCSLIYLSTFSFQAPDFYLKQGYEIFAELQLPTGDKRLYLKKAI